MTDEIKISFYKGSLKNEITVKNFRNIFAQCLQIENLNFLIGAGCSSYCEQQGDDWVEKAIPTMKSLADDFYDENEDFCLNESINPKDKYPNNLEEVINHLISYRNICFDEDKLSDVNDKITNINEFIFNKVAQGSENNDVIDLYKNFYSHIIYKKRRTPINIFTTNYDIYSELALDELKYVYNNGFSGGTKRIFNPNTYNYVLVENLNLSKQVWYSVNNFINLFKIHGSITWLNDGRNIIERELDMIRTTNEYKSLMIYPTPEKDRSTLMTPYSDLFRMMQNNLLKKNSTLVVIGYSFGDDHINRIILNALSVYDFRLIIFGQSDQIEKLIELNDPRIWVVNSDNDFKIHYFNEFVKHVLPPLDDEQTEIIKFNEKIDKIADVLRGDNDD